MIKRLLLLLVLNFGGLALGSIFTNPGVNSDWYQNLSKAPWTPPGWVFGSAWTLIMICFSIYLSLLWPKITEKSSLIGLIVVAWILNVAWNPLFFAMHQVAIALVTISLLLLVICIFFFKYWHKIHLASLLLAPYIIWLMIATSLNAYILLKNPL